MDSKDRQRLLRGVGMNFLGGLGMALRPLFFVLITRLFGADEFGLFALALAPLEVLAFLVAGGPADAAQRHAARDPDAALDRESWRHIHRAVASALLCALALAALALAAVALAGPALAGRAWQRPEAYPVLLLLAASLPFTAILTVLLAALRALMFMGADVAVRSVAIPLVLLGGALVAHIIEASARALAVVWLISQILGAALALLCFARHYSVALLWQGRRGRHREILGFALPQSLNMTLTQATWNLDLIMLGALGRPMVDDAALGIYRIGSEIARQIFSLRVSFASVYASLVARYSLEGNHEGIRLSFGRVSRWVMLVAAPVTALAVLYHQALIRLFDPAYTGDTSFLLFLLAGALVACGVGLSGNILVMSGYPRYNLMNSAILTVVNAGMNLALIPGFGLAGAAVATMTATVGIQILQLVELRWLMRLTPDLRPLALPLGAAALGLGLALAAAHAQAPAPVPGVLLGVLYGAMVLGALRRERSRRVASRSSAADGDTAS